MQVRWAIALAVGLAALLGTIFVWQRTASVEQAQPARSAQEKRLSFAIDQLERICLSDFDTNERTEVSAQLKVGLKNSGGHLASGRALEIARGASEALPADLRIEERARVRQCLIDNLDFAMAALEANGTERKEVDQPTRTSIPAVGASSRSSSTNRGPNELQKQLSKTEVSDNSAAKIAVLASLLREGMKLIDNPDDVFDLQYQNWVDRASGTLEKEFDPGVSVDFERANYHGTIVVINEENPHRRAIEANLGEKLSYLDKLMNDLRRRAAPTKRQAKPDAFK